MSQSKLVLRNRVIGEIRTRDKERRPKEIPEVITR